MPENAQIAKLQQQIDYCVDFLDNLDTGGLWDSDSRLISRLIKNVYDAVMEIEDSL
jgi:hypothetical protein